MRKKIDDWIQKHFSLLLGHINLDAVNKTSKSFDTKKLGMCLLLLTLLSKYQMNIKVMNQTKLQLAGAYLAAHESRNFGGDTSKKGTTPKLKFKKLTDIVKQIVYIGVIDPAESKYGLIFQLSLLLPCHFCSFCRKL